MSVVPSDHECRGIFLLALLILLSFLTTPVAAQEEQATERGDYRVGIGDVIEVEAFQEDEISGEFSIEASGAITFPLLGAVPVAGMTAAEIASSPRRAARKGLLRRCPAQGRGQGFRVTARDLARRGADAGHLLPRRPDDPDASCCRRPVD